MEELKNKDLTAERYNKIKELKLIYQLVEFDNVFFFKIYGALFFFTF